MSSDVGIVIVRKITDYLELDIEGKYILNHIDDSKVALSFSETAVLNELVSHQGEICDKETLLGIGWPNRIVAPSSLTQCISTLRRKLTPFSEINLQAIARRGYQIQIVEQSQVKLVSLHDSETIRQAIVDVSPAVKAFGIILLFVLLAVLFYFSTNHRVTQIAHQWHDEPDISLNLGGQVNQLPLLSFRNSYATTSQNWQRHIDPAHNTSKAPRPFKGVALATSRTHSFAACFLDGITHDSCQHSGAINLVAMESQPAAVDYGALSQIIAQVSDRFRYNRVLIPQGSEGHVTEHHYHADVFFPRANKKLIRGDFAISLIYERNNYGKFFYSVCITDEDCLGEPIKFNARGEFRKFSRRIGEHYVDIFYVTPTQHHLPRPDAIRDFALPFYQELRRVEVSTQPLIFYRLQDEGDKSLWVLPFMGNIVAWANYEKVRL
ncbi:CadC family transcriptional regulator [Paraferrimonas haliotis]|uniref:CadC family transcriptional regulator n=1 Tax=Paraferrimonas haliotis TaxID=2013866 RepID=A0AA37WVC0_9GAMM|nr:CadC family transcriptional regulator [Paraferrimonas haliotis]